MKDIDLALKELRQTLLSIKIFDVLLESLIVMAATMVFTTYFSMVWYYAFIPFGAYLAYGVQKRVNIKSYHEVEDKVPQLREALQTAADTRNDETQLVKELQEDVLRKMRAIKTTYFLGLGKTTKQLLLLTGLSFVVIGLSAFNVNFDSTKDFVGKQKIVQDALGALGEFGNDNVTKGRRTDERENVEAHTGKFVKLEDDELFGEAQIVELGDTPLELRIDPVMSGANLKDPQEVKDKKFKEQQAGSIEAAAQGACAEECSIPKDQQDIVKNYFEKVGTG